MSFSASSILNNFGSFGSSAPIPLIGSVSAPTRSSLSSTLNSLVMNNAKHFASYGSDLPIPVLEQVVKKESVSKTHAGHGGKFGEPEDVVQQGNNPHSSYASSAYGISAPNIAETDYINAELAKHYGMSKSTAYQEALANTAYQRAVKDLKAAGLNPAVLFGNGRVQSANSAIYGTEAVSGAGGYVRSSGGKSNNGKLFSSSAYGAISTIGGLMAAVGTKNPANYWIGSSVAQGAMNLMNAFNQR